MHYRKIILALILLVLVIGPRLASLKSFATVDEAFWLPVGANFYYALAQREFQNTVYEYHPAVTTMWFITGGMLVYFPEYRGFGQGYFDVDKDKFDTFLLEHGKSLLELLYYSRLFQLALIALLVLTVFLLLALLMGYEISFLAAALTASAPFLLGHSLLLNHEALLALCVLTSMLAMMVYLEYKRKLLYLLISAGAAALAQLTKSPAIVLLPMIALILAVSVFQRRKEAGINFAIWDHFKIFAVWSVSLALVYFMLWPGMWVAPGRMLYEVYGNALSYAFQGARLQVTHELQMSQFSLAAAAPVMRSFRNQLIWRNTPVIWMGLLLVLGSLFLRGGRAPSSASKRLYAYLLITAVLFMLMFSVAQGRNSAHYIMSSHVSLAFMAALGWGFWLSWLAALLRTAARPVLQAELMAILVGLQLWSALAFYPYYYTYYNPLMAALTHGKLDYGYGEGMELAAAYLASKPNSDTLTVFAYHGRGPFSYFFPGKTLIVNPLFLEDPGMGSMIERLVQSEYLVFYEEFGTRSRRTAQFVAALEGIQPEKVISVQGLENILIYRVADFPQEFYDAISKVEK